MGKQLVLAEKPSVARELARVLGCSKGGKGYLEGSNHIVTWALGHLVTLADPDAYNAKYQKWVLEDLPMIPEKMELVVMKETAGQYGTVRQLLHRPDVDGLIIATDAGREGELVARWIIAKAVFRKPIKRLWISSQTDKAIREGFANLKPGEAYVNLYKSAQSRAEADWLVGLNVTRALTCKYNAQLSAGRVQTPTLAMVVAREEEIRRFIPQDYWTLQAITDGMVLLWRDKSGQARLSDKIRAEAIAKAVSGQIGRITQLEKSGKEELPPLGYDLTSLQMDANKKYGLSAKQTSNAMQQLYEHYKLVTYPRTDSKHITRDIVPTLPERLKCIAVGPYRDAVAQLLRTGVKTTRRFVDDAKVTDHHAIIPTEQFVDLNGLKPEERHIYDLVVKRFLAVLSPAYEYEQTTVRVEAGGEIFQAKGRIVKSLGWRAIYQEAPADMDADDDDSEQNLPDLKKGGLLPIRSVKIINGKTRPPARYNEATLLAAMEHPGKFIDDDRLREAMDAGSGLGTPATRADILEKLFDSFYMERRGKEISPTAKGKQLIELVPNDLKSPELTARWEQMLLRISKGQADPLKFTADMRLYAAKLVSNVIADTGTYKHENLTREKCPTCGKFMLEVNGKRGKMLVCVDRECGARVNLSQTSNARCPECHKKMEIRGDGDNKAFFCGCGYREKLSAFKERVGDRVDKREVTQFLQNQEAPDNINSALAEALKQWGK